jgi:hypothetical protein
MSQNCGHQLAYCSSPGWYVSMEMMMMPAGVNSYLIHLKGYLTFRKILRHGTSAFTSHPKEGVLRIFIAIKNPSPRPAFYPRTFAPVAITLTTTPPMHFVFIYFVRFSLQTASVSLNGTDQLIFVMVRCFLWGADWILECYTFFSLHDVHEIKLKAAALA